MTDDIDIYRSAAVLMREHGEDARIHAEPAAQQNDAAIASIAG